MLYFANMVNKMALLIQSMSSHIVGGLNLNFETDTRSLFSLLAEDEETRKLSFKLGMRKR